MDFFSEQDQARRSSKILVVLFATSVLVLIAITNIVVVFTLWLFDEQLVGNYQAYQQSVNTLHYQPSRGLTMYFSWRRFALIAAAVSAVIACAIVYKWRQLAGGGKRVAEQLGGQRLQPNTNDIHQQRLLNVVEEMALASGMPVPPIYLLNHELGINAFAAGLSSADAIIGVTRGCVDQLNREQLQGVIAHEFSHILNGDMRLNMRLIAILHGILFVGSIGKLLLHGGRPRSTNPYMTPARRNSGNRLALLGIAFVIIGWLGQFFGRLIKAAVSRQREYLADAYAVQFTRNPQGIADALKIIGGYLPAAVVHSPAASEISHLFFGQSGSSSFRLFSTHPPIERRILRIEPGWDGKYIQRKIPVSMAQQQHSEISSASNEQSNPLVSNVTTHSKPDTAPHDINSDNVSNISNAIPASLYHQSHEPFSAMAILFGLLLSDTASIKVKQFQYIEASGFAGLNIQTRQLQPDIALLDQSQRLPLIELALPALKCMSPQQFKQFKKTLLLLIRADRKMDLFEWCLYQLVRHYLDAEFTTVKPSRPLYSSVDKVSEEFQLILSLMAYHAHSDMDLCRRAFGRGANSAGLYNINLEPREHCTLDNFARSVNTLANCYPLIKPRLLKALTDCANHDGYISAVEKEIVAGIAAVIDCPIPHQWARQQRY